MNKASPWRRLWFAPVVVAGLVILGILVATFYPSDPRQMVAPPLVPPFSNGLLFGSDILGRDVAAGVLAGSKTSLVIAGVATAMALVIGVSIGAVAGFLGGMSESLLMGFTELFQTIPAFLLAIVIVAIIGPSLFTIAGAIGLVSWPALARLTRSEVAKTKARTFTRAAITLGESPAAILTVHIMPNSLGPIIVMTSFIAADAMLVEGGLSFLGLGDSNYISWGGMINSGRTVLLQAWWISAFPGLALLLTVLAITLAGEAASKRMGAGVIAGVR